MATVSTDSTYTFTVTGNRSLTAVFEKIIPTYTITATIDPPEAGTVTGAGRYQEGATVTLTATPADGYQFTGWREDGQTVSTDTTYTFTVAEDRTLVGAFAVISRLPDGYTELEYVQSNSTTGINTGFYPNLNTTRVVMELSDIKYNTGASMKSDQWIIATGGTSFSGTYKYFSLWLNSQTTIGWRDASYSYVQKTVSFNTGRNVIDFDLPNKKLIVNNTEFPVTSGNYALTSSPTCIGNAFANNTCATFKLHSAKIYTNDTIKRDFVPCTDPSGAVGLYDLVSNLFYKCWIGSLTAGPAA